VFPKENLNLSSFMHTGIGIYSGTEENIINSVILYIMLIENIVFGNSFFCLHKNKNIEKPYEELQNRSGVIAGIEEK